MEFVDAELRDLDVKELEGIVRLVGMLCGLRLEPSESDRALLGSMMAKADKINYEQLNEILLLLNQHRISRQFYRFFFCAGSRDCDAIDLGQFKSGVEKFRGFAMLCFGNFRFAFRKLRTAAAHEFDKEVEKYCEQSEDEINREYRNRPPMAVNIEPVDKERTWHVGYLSAAKLFKDQLTLMAIELALQQTTEEKVTEFLRNHLEKQYSHRAGVTTIDQVASTHGRNARHEAERYVSQQTDKLVQEVVRTAGSPRLRAESWRAKLDNVRGLLTQYAHELDDTRDRAKKNTDIYLTWDYMDVYVATSMREKWEYEKGFDFVREVFGKNGPLGDLNLRFFDPTQSYCPDRIDKGLIEGLMLRRAECTVYLAQETDTLGKDSELASTLAQGKPVIAYVPEFQNFEEDCADIAKQPLAFHHKRGLLLDAEDIFSEPACLDELPERVKPNLSYVREARTVSFLERKEQLFGRLRDAISRRTFNLLEDEDKVLKSELGRDYEEICQILAVAEKHYFNKRADTLKRSHPLAVQVHLDSGVAWGVLVVRNGKHCAELIRKILMNQMSFNIVHELGATQLSEEKTGCPYRVVTDNAKLTNSFWNFYLTPDTFRE